MAPQPGQAREMKAVETSETLTSCEGTRANAPYGTVSLHLVAGATRLLRDLWSVQYSTSFLDSLSADNLHNTMGIPVDYSHAPCDHEHQATRLRSIKPATVLPEQYTARVQALTALKRIESVEVRETVRRNGHRYYVIDIYYKLSQSRIPTNRKVMKTGVQGRRPDKRIERRLSEVGNLRDEMYYHAHNGHGSQPCSFCKSLVDYVLYGPAKPRTLLRWLDGNDHIQQTLTQFLTEILSLTTKVKACGGNECQGQEHIPILLQNFLFDPERSVQQY